MYKAILVDDENFDLIGMQQLIPWSSLQIEIVYSSTKPLAALSYIQENEIDILITDIKMPVMSGLELAKAALQKNAGLKVMFISGYQDFEYAKQALHLKADGYILKPVDDDEVIETLKRVVAALDERARFEKATDANLESFEFVKHNFLLHLMEGTIEEETLQAFMRKYPVEVSVDRAHAVIIEIDDAARMMQGQQAESDPITTTARLIVSYIESHGLGLWYRLSPTRIGLIYSGYSEHIERDFNGLLSEIRANGNTTATISYGQAVSGIPMLPASFKEARELIDCKMFIGKNRIISPGASQTAGVRNAKDMNAILDQLFKSISNYSLVVVCDCIEELFESVQAFAEPVKVYHFSTHIISRLEGYLSDAGTSSEVLANWKNNGFAAVQQFETIDDIKSWLRRTAFELSEMLYMRSQKPVWRLYADIEEFVTANLASDITLKDMASRFSYSPNHFGVLFKEQVGISFNDYVVSRRMAKAKEMLQQPQYKIYEIADRVGYKSLTYFSRMFKEAFGMTPGDYRKQS
ncbi:two component transcriptional regulator, AraC family [Paenibacillus curdlanolyticus YK9]|uniref:Two component transcriptional regulator, AraC family n=1 Tax=Paenibacillus curdlanolyticus YK9 TaxID=717606 RepID=E0IBK3_9BACL|nr:helix-turn-helix domain-containing protein [Paenibacillus curdlanolyticus]EFM10083.1 two component transcriptional regulator, AraC family [Paenibacillus curdlanolyticus YK9]